MSCLQPTSFCAGKQAGGRTAQLAQVDLLAAGHDDVAEVVQAHAGGQVDGEVAHQQGQECVQRLRRAFAALLLQGV